MSTQLANEVKPRLTALVTSTSASFDGGKKQASKGSTRHILPAELDELDFQRISSEITASIDADFLHDPFSEIRNLRDGWAGPGTEAPDAEFVERAEELWWLLDGVLAPSMERPGVRAGACDVIAFEWRDPDTKAELQAWLHNRDSLAIDWTLISPANGPKFGSVRSVNGLLNVVRRYFRFRDVE